MTRKSPIALFLNKRTGIYAIRVPVPGTERHRLVPTGERDRARALAAVMELGTDRIVHLAHAQAVNAQTLSIVNAGRNFTCRQLFDLWKERLAVHVAPRTAETYGQHLATFFDGLDCWTRPVAWVTEQQLHAWVNDGQCHRNTASSRAVALSSFFRYAHDKGTIPTNTASLVSVHHRAMTLSQLEPKHVRPFTEDEYLRLLALPVVVKKFRFSRVTEQYWLDWSILAYCCGYRLTDCACMEWAAFTTDTIVVYPKKSRRATRVVIPLNDPLIARPELLALIDRLAQTPRRHPTFIWPEHAAGIRSSRRTHYSDNFRRECGKAGIDGGMKHGVTFHSLRRSCAVRLKAAGKTMKELAATLGHKSIVTTAIYTESAKKLPV